LIYNVRCKFCSRYVKKLGNKGRCEECEKEYQNMLDRIVKYYSEELQKIMVK